MDKVKDKKDLQEKKFMTLSSHPLHPLPNHNHNLHLHSHESPMRSPISSPLQSYHPQDQSVFSNDEFSNEEIQMLNDLLFHDHIPPFSPTSSNYELKNLEKEWNEALPLLPNKNRQDYINSVQKDILNELSLSFTTYISKPEFH